MTRNMIFAFIGGVMVGISGTVAVMKKVGYIRLTDEELDILHSSEVDNKSEQEGSSDPSLEDKTSFKMEKTTDTRKVRYDHLEDKPDVETLVKKYIDEPTDETEDEETEDDDNGDPDPDLAYVDQYDDHDTEDYGTIIKQIPGKRKDQLIYLVPQEYAGEIYFLEQLTYYAEDDVLADITDSAIDDPLSVIGDSLEYFGHYGADEDMMFIRNCTLGIEYEVTKVYSSWAAKLYGVDIEKKSGKVKKTKMPRREDEV